MSRIERTNPHHPETERATGSTRLETLRVRGFGSLAHVDLELRQINVMIGANACGKSNLIKLFLMLNRMLTRPGELQQFVAEQGGASQILHFGPSTTREIELELRVSTEKGQNDYQARWFYVAGDRLLYSQECLRFLPPNAQPPHTWTELGGGHAESQMLSVNPGASTPSVIAGLLRQIRVYRFHDTSPTGPLRQNSRERSPRYLAADGANLPAFLAHLAEDHQDCFQRIEEQVRRVYPAFGHFAIDDVGPAKRLGWRERNRDYLFDTHQASDGTLRFFALAALLLQPPERLPAVLILDEPELGLHPHAVAVLGELLRDASMHCQLIIATQSPLLADQFDPEDILTVEREDGATRFSSLDDEALVEWMETFEESPELSEE